MPRQPRCTKMAQYLCHLVASLSLLKAAACLPTLLLLLLHGQICTALCDCLTVIFCCPCRCCCGCPHVSWSVGVSRLSVHTSGLVAGASAARHCMRQTDNMRFCQGTLCYDSTPWRLLWYRLHLWGSKDAISKAQVSEERSLPWISVGIKLPARYYCITISADNATLGYLRELSPCPECTHIKALLVA